MKDTITTTPASSRILVAEDDAVLMRMVIAILENAGYKVVTACDGREAYRILRNDADFAAAIFDMHMPHLKGLDIVRQMQTERRLRRIPVMIMTAEQDLAICSEFFAAGTALFIQKPFSPARMKAMLGLLVSKTAALRNDKTIPQNPSGADNITSEDEMSAAR